MGVVDPGDEVGETSSAPPWWLRGLPGLLIAVALLAFAAAVLLAARWGGDALTVVTDVGRFHLVLANVVPGPMMLAAVGATLVAVTAGIAASNLLAASRAVRQTGRDKPAGFPLRREITQHRSTARVRITVLIPAHNEQDRLPDALASLAAQHRPADAVWVIADNCTDDTVSVAQEGGAQVYATVENVDRKAGGLNQLLTRLLPEAGADDAFLVMDADTSLAPQFLLVAAQALEARPELDAVGGVFRGEPGGGLIGLLQRNEYDRYSRDISRRQARVFVLTGTASLFRADTLAAVTQSRGRYLPGNAGKVYDTVALTEDNELTLAVRSLGADLLSPQECRVSTELMPTWRDLWRQRMRWQRGALENIGAYGLTSATARYWMQQTAIGYGTVALWSFFAVTTISLLAGVLVVFPFWLAVGAVFWVERVTTVWRSGWVPRLLAATLVVELAYDVFLQSVYIASLFDIATGRDRQWSHVAASGTQDVT